MSDFLRPHELQHARPPCPSPTPRVYSNSCPQSRWCHPAISSSVVPFSSCPQSLPASGSFPMSQLFTRGGQSIGVSASASVLPMTTRRFLINDYWVTCWTNPCIIWKMLDSLSLDKFRLDCKLRLQWVMKMSPMGKKLKLSSLTMTVILVRVTIYWLGIDWLLTNWHWSLVFTLEVQRNFKCKVVS